MKNFFQFLISLLQKYPRPIISGVVSIVLVLLIYFSAQMLPDLQTREDETTRQLDVMMKNISQGGDLHDQLQTLIRLTSNMNSRLMNIDDKAANYQFFYDIEGKSRASIGDLKQGNADQGDGILRAKLSEFTGLGFTLTVSGRIGYVMSFLKRLEGGKYFVRCNSISLSGNKVLGPDAVDATLKLETLAKKP